MNIKIILRFVFLVVLVCASCSESKSKKEIQKPNIILIMTDDQGWGDVGFNGNTDIRTPNIDLLASNGVILDRFYSASAVCSPTRASVLTGRNPLRVAIPYANTGHMKKAELTIPEILKEQKYRTGHFGKWHLGTLSKTIKDANRGGNPKFENEYTIPTDHGYDYFFSTESKVPTYDPMIYPTNFLEGESKRYGWRAITNADSTKAYGTAYWIAENKKVIANLKGDDSRIIMDRVIPFIENAINEDKPFFSTIWLHTPHLPVVSDSLHRSYYKDFDLEKQIYYGTLTAMDEQIGRLWNKLEELNMDENTILFFCSDNGPERQTPGSAGVFRGVKRSLYEGGVRVPAFVVWKNNLDGGRRINYPIVTSDYMPTILDMLNLEYPLERPIDGVSVLAALKGSEQERTTPIGFICDPQISWVTHQYKLIGDENRENFELYDVLKDMSETENCIDEYPEVAEKLKADLFEWLNSVENSSKGMDYEYQATN
jgi:arylsulfatase A-like enzyme